MEAKNIELKLAIKSQKRKAKETSHKSFGSAVLKQQLLAKGGPTVVQSSKFVQPKTPLTPKALVDLPHKLSSDPFLNYTISSQAVQKHDLHKKQQQRLKIHCFETEIGAFQPSDCWTLKPLQAAAERLTTELDFNDCRIVHWQKSQIDKIEKCFGKIKKKAISFFCSNFDVFLTDF